MDFGKKGPGVQGRILASLESEKTGLSPIMEAGSTTFSNSCSVGHIRTVGSQGKAGKLSETLF